MSSGSLREGEEERVENEKFRPEQTQKLSWSEVVKIRNDAVRRKRSSTTAIVLYCSRCDYFKKTAVSGPIGTHGCVQCNGFMEVYVPQELVAPEWVHADV